MTLILGTASAASSNKKLRRLLKFCEYGDQAACVIFEYLTVIVLHDNSPCLNKPKE